MPPHAGHQYLIRFAQAFTRDLTVFLCSLAREPIPGELRFNWMSQLFPGVRLVHITEEIPQASRSREGAHRIWADAIRSRIDADPRYAFASEEYGRELAASLGAEFVPVDPHREVFPVSAGMIRDDPFSHWSYIPDVVRPYFARKIAVSDPAGTLAQELARAYDTVFATDYPAYVASLGLGGALVDSAYEVSRAQAASEEALLLHANRVLFTPTDPLRILCDRGVPAIDREPLVSSLLAAHPHLAPSLVVSVEPVADDYREAIDACGWPFVAVRDRDAARRRCIAQLDDWLA